MAKIQKTLGALIKGHPKVLRVLDKHGVHFCAGCYLTLSSPLDKVAAYHAVPDREKFIRDIERALARRKKTKKS